VLVFHVFDLEIDEPYKETHVPETAHRHAPDGDDYAKLRDLHERVTGGIDHRDAELFLSAFAPDARQFRMSPNNEIERESSPADAFAAGPLKMSPDIRTLHILCNARFEVDDDSAVGEVYVVAHQFAPNGFPSDHPLVLPPGLPDAQSLMRIVYSRSNNRYRKVAGNWRIAETRTWGEGIEVRPVYIP
jgi:hypothetical protein